MFLIPKVTQAIAARGVPFPRLVLLAGSSFAADRWTLGAGGRLRADRLYDRRVDHAAELLGHGRRCTIQHHERMAIERRPVMGSLMVTAA